ncbi:ATP-binding protein, partial [Streptomyces sp. NPDC005534]|uniref:ATP-binding protein n=1 Tax=Streptomyces sp. NPDC005534 TaxID=3155714 RepID=UPI003453876D
MNPQTLRSWVGPGRLACLPGVLRGSSPASLSLGGLPGSRPDHGQRRDAAEIADGTGRVAAKWSRHGQHQPRDTKRPMRAFLVHLRHLEGPTRAQKWNNVLMSAHQNVDFETAAGRGASGMFVGREAELTALTQSAVQAGQGVPGVVVVEGESGIGKTALVRQALNRLEGFTVWWAACVPEEQDWAFGALQQWLRRVDRAALADFEVLGQPLGPRAAPSAVGAELVELMDAVQADGPVALVLDDVQWADEESLRALRFLVRRLFADRILLVVTARTSSARTGQGHVPGHEWRRLESDSAHTQVVRLSGLDEGEVSLLAGARHRSASGVMHRLWQHTGGHPLHLLSLMGTVPAADLADPRRPLPVPVSLSAAVGQNLAALPADSRALCEALAVLDMRVRPGPDAGAVADPDDRRHPGAAPGDHPGGPH